MTNGTSSLGGQTLPIQILSLCMKLQDTRASKEEVHQGSLRLTMYKCLYLRMQSVNIETTRDVYRQILLLRQTNKIVQMPIEATAHYKNYRYLKYGEITLIST